MPSLTDRMTAPASVQPIAASILLDRTLMGSEGRKRLRRVFGKEHETFEGSIPGMRFLPVWLFVLDDATPRLAHDKSERDQLPTVVLTGPANKVFHPNLTAPEGTSEEAALRIVQFIREELNK